tara:strand:- start:33 stop:593 length:561 start_codon:yes stop_codon:yes gene_type:complete
MNNMGKTIKMKDRKNIGNILILEHVQDEVLKNNDKGYTLFGKREYVQLEDGDYDFVFHYIKGIPINKIKTQSFTTIPVLPYQYPQEEDNAVLEMGEIYQENNLLSTFAIRDNSVKRYSTKQKKEEKLAKSLKFYNVTRMQDGRVITSIDSYSITNYKECESSFIAWGEIKGYLSRLTTEIERTYKD